MCLDAAQPLLLWRLVDRSLLLTFESQGCNAGLVLGSSPQVLKFSGHCPSAVALCRAVQEIDDVHSTGMALGDHYVHFVLSPVSF